VHVWTIEEGFWIGNEFGQTRCAARNFRGHEVLLHWFKLAPVPNRTIQDRRTPLPVRGAIAREQASVPLILYRLTSPGDDSLHLLHESTRWLGKPTRVYASRVKEGLHLAGDRRRQFRFQEIKHHEHRLLGVLLGDPCFLYNQVYYLFVHGELSARA